ncbi:CRISPR-associated protein [Anabaena azotica]|uniref:CRISPR-associated protein n=1 Tax=Anabaena azotica FACHB-119 TaxID=947527 RepID=A0ABR8D645_9NOST|nr:CRISPR-associated protein [Anabaena azotica]MBD2501986.1 CRISPR-associated protein [Anabaena azotica FACHB-119]
MYRHLIIINPLGLMYGSAGAFLSPENLVGISGAKFPPDATTLSGLFFSANKINKFQEHEELRDNLYLAGPFWAEIDNPEYFYIPIPWTKIINQDEKQVAEWTIQESKWYRPEQTKDLEPDCRWQTVNSWEDTADVIRRNFDAAKNPWEYVPMLHPRLKDNQRNVEDENGLFLENTVQMGFHLRNGEPKDTCLVYLSTYALPDGWYCFGGENHLVEITSIPLLDDSPIIKLLQQKIHRSFALITPGIWGSTHYSYRYPQHPDFPKPTHILTDRPSPYRYRVGDRKGRGRLGRGRYAVPPGTVYILDEPLNKTWWGNKEEAGFPDEWFPKEGFGLKKVGCGLCLPITIEGVD